MLVTPAATAQLLTVRFTRLMLLAALVGVASAIVGLYLSYWLDVASGATIVLVQTGLFAARARASGRGACWPAPAPGRAPADADDDRACRPATAPLTAPADASSGWRTRRTTSSRRWTAPGTG